MVSASNEIPRALALDQHFDIPRSHAKYRILHTKGEAQRPDIVRKAWQIHGKCYVDFGYFTKDSLLEDGTLDPKLDGTRERQGVPLSVTYLLAVPGVQCVDEAEGALRIIDADTGCITYLPTYKYFNDTSTLVRRRIDSIIDTYGEQNVREIAALSLMGDRVASFELMRAIVQNAMNHKQVTGEREVFLTSLTDVSLHPVVDLAGASAVTMLGDAVSIFQDDPRANRTLRVTPVLLEPCRVIEALLEEALATTNTTRKSVLRRRLSFFTDGLMDDQIDDEILQYLYETGLRQPTSSNWHPYILK